MIREDIYIVEVNSNYDDHIECFIKLWLGSQDEWCESDLTTICYYLTSGDLYFIRKEFVEVDEDGTEYDADDFETVGFIGIDYMTEEIQALDYIYIKKEERRKGYATKAYEQVKQERTVDYISQLITPDGQAFLDSFDGYDKKWKGENI